MSDGPQAARRLPACDYAKGPGGTALPNTWNWAAQSFEILASDPVVRIPSPEDPLRDRNISPITDFQPDSTMRDASPSTLNSSVTNLGIPA